MSERISVEETANGKGKRSRGMRNKTPKTAWGELFLRPFLDAMNEKNKPSGRNLSKDRRILDMKWTSRKITAKVARLKGRYYRISFELDRWAANDWSKVIECLASDFQLMAALQSGQLPPQLEPVLQDFGLTLFPSADQVDSLECNCLAWDTFCKHRAGLIFHLTSMIDEDPLLLLATHGLEREKLLEKVGAKRTALSRRSRKGNKIASIGRGNITSSDWNAEVIAHIASRIESDIVMRSDAEREGDTVNMLLPEQRSHVTWPNVKSLIDAERAATIFDGFHATDREARTPSVVTVSMESSVQVDPSTFDSDDRARE